jgi:hypothetical protein
VEKRVYPVRAVYLASGLGAGATGLVFVVVGALDAQWGVLLTAVIYLPLSCALYGFGGGWLLGKAFRKVVEPPGEVRPASPAEVNRFLAYWTLGSAAFLAVALFWLRKSGLHTYTTPGILLGLGVGYLILWGRQPRLERERGQRLYYLSLIPFKAKIIALPVGATPDA